MFDALIAVFRPRDGTRLRTVAFGFYAQSALSVFTCSSSRHDPIPLDTREYVSYKAPNRNYVMGFHTVRVWRDSNRITGSLRG